MRSNPSTKIDDIASAKGVGALQHAFAMVRDWFRGEQIEDGAALLAFVDRNAALVAQKCAIDYCRGKAGTFSQTLFREKPFIEALTRCRWESYAAVLSDIVLIAEMRLIEAARAIGRQEALKPALLALYREALHAYPIPVHRPQGWDDAIAEFERRQAAFDAPTARVDVLAQRSARAMFEALPIHTNMRKFDEEIVFGAVRFHFVAVTERLDEQLRAAAVAQSLLSGD
jgi:hypothetical protein